MVADTSALIAILMRESDARTYSDAIQRNRPVLVSIATAVEFLIVALGKGAEAYQGAVAMLQGNDIELVPLDEAQLWIADEANRRYGQRPPSGRPELRRHFRLRAGVGAGIAIAVQGQ